MSGQWIDSTRALFVVAVAIMASPVQAQNSDARAIQTGQMTPVGAAPATGTPDAARNRSPNSSNASPPATTHIRNASPRAGGPPGPDVPVVSEPSQGRPIFVKPGDTFIFIMRVSEKVSGDVGFFLVHGREPAVRVPLKPTTPPSFSEDYCTLVLQLPDETLPGLYDMEVRTASGNYSSRRSVRVVDQFKNRFRFVHLSDMNVGDLTAPEFDDMLPREINLLAPEFIVATGDFTEWARARDDAASWPRVLKYFEQFDAPVYMLCGEHDHEASFMRYVANKPIGTIDYGEYHGLLLLDHPGNPIEQDYGQIQWIEADLKKNRQRRFNFICTNSDELGLLDVWRETGDLARMVSDYKVRLILAGGASDWDLREFSAKLSGLGGLHFVRTHESSTSLRDRATGVSHYRVIDVDGDRLAYTYPSDDSIENLQHSIPAGRLRAFYDGPNDGSATRLVVTVQNALNQSFKDARLWLRVAKVGRQRPVVAPGVLVKAVDLDGYWACEVSVDLPDKGAVRVMAASEPGELPPPVPIEAELIGPRDWNFTAQTTSFGLSYYQANAPVTLRLTNRSGGRQTVWPVVRLNGQQLGLNPRSCPRLPLTLEGGKAVDLPLVLQARRVSPGMHELQVYFLEDPLCRLQKFEIQMGTGQGVAGLMDSVE
ncbi:MAG: hypothetical protein DCC65_07440 [Planctomycetota bacterium]|nr:MAG: hypothetical protein DCC65_07440 [Planctomycetota bacterium]